MLARTYYHLPSQSTTSLMASVGGGSEDQDSYEDSPAGSTGTPGTASGLHRASTGTQRTCTSFPRTSTSSLEARSQGRPTGSEKTTSETQKAPTGTQRAPTGSQVASSGSSWSSTRARGAPTGLGLALEDPPGGSIGAPARSSSVTGAEASAGTEDPGSGAIVAQALRFPGGPRGLL